MHIKINALTAETNKQMTRVRLVYREAGKPSNVLNHFLLELTLMTDLNPGVR